MAQGVDAQSDDANGGVVKYTSTASAHTPAPAAPLPAPASTNDRPGVYARLGDASSDKEQGTVRLAESNAQPTTSESQGANQQPTRKQLLDPSRFRVESNSSVVAVPESQRPDVASLERLPTVAAPVAVAEPVVKSQPVEASLSDLDTVTSQPQTTPGPHVAPVSIEYGAVAQLSDQVDESSVINYVVSPVAMRRLPPVMASQIPNEAETGNLIQVSSRVSSPVENDRYRFARTQDDNDELSKPELVDLRDIDSPLNRLAFEIQEGVPFGDETPDDIAIDRFGEFTLPPLDTGEIRTLGGMGNPWALSVAAWEAPGFYHRPLYFEQPNVERYGHYVPRWQPAISGAHFFGSIVALPYKMWVYPPCDPIYTLGHHRPGSCNPHQIHYLPLGR